MTTELEEQFFKVFGVEKKCQCKNFINYADCFRIPTECKEYNYPKITDRKLLEMICIYNSFQNDEASLLVPFDINNIKDIALQVITKSVKDKTLNNYYCNDIEKLKTNIQQLFKGGE